MSTSRREFIRNSAIASAAVAAGIPVPGHVQEAVVEGDKGLKWSKAPCRYCGTGCGACVPACPTTAISLAALTAEVLLEA